jgi:DNA-binding beta-propeller fold protein YncE
MYWPLDMVVHPTSGEIYIVDWNNHIYRKVALDGTISTAFGSGIHGDDFDGPVKEINLNHPGDVTVGPEGDFYLTVWHNHKIKRVDRNTNFAISFAGTDQGFTGDGGPADIAQMALPSSSVFDPAGNLYVSDQANGRVRRVNTQRIINTFAGRFVKGYRDGIGQVAMFSWSRGNDALPGGKLAITPAGDAMYLADQENNRIRKIDIATAEVTTVAGTGDAGYSGDGGDAMSAALNYPCDVSCAPNGDVYVADTRNNVIRKIDNTGIITTVAGTGIKGFSPNATPATEAMLNSPFGVFFDGAKNTLYIADTYNSQVKKVIMPE